MENSDLPYLKEAIDLNIFVKGLFYLLIAPCGAGKTTAAMEGFASLASDRACVLFLIDTSAGKSALLGRGDTQRVTREWLEDMETYAEWWGIANGGDGVRVMTYHQFGMLIQERGTGWLNGIEVIICDEIHDLSKYIDIDKARANEATGYCLTAYETLTHIKDKYVIAMTATPQRILKRLSAGRVPGKKLDFRGRVRSYKVKETRYFPNFDVLWDMLPTQGKILLYTRHVSDLIKIPDDFWWFDVLPLWSVWKTDIPMSEEQLDARNYLLKHEHFPDGYDCLCINAAYETGLNIRDEDLQTVVVNDSSSETITQVCGRVRHNIETLFLPDRQLEHLGTYLPEKYFDKPLFLEDKQKIIHELQLKLKGELIGTSKLTSLLKEQGYVDREHKARSGPNKDKRYMILKKPPADQRVPA